MSGLVRNDDAKSILYILVNTRDHNVISYGMTFREFVHSLQKPLTNLLLLNSRIEDSEFHFHTRLNYVLNEQLPQLLKKDLHKDGSFCWIDFEDVFSLDTIEGQELAELLYLGHMNKHLSPPFFQNLNNRFAYLSENDGRLNKIYYRHWSDFYETLGGLLALKLSDVRIEKTFMSFRKKKIFPPVSSRVLHQLNVLLTEGIIFSFSHFSQSRTDLKIPFWVIGDYSDMDEMMDAFREASTSEPKGYLIMDKKQKEWSLSLY